MRTLKSTPRADGFVMPAEWRSHSQCWLLWPERPDIWHLGAKPAQHAMADFAEAIARFEPVTVGVSRRQYENARQRLSAGIRVIEASYDGAWIRDTGPTFVANDSGTVRGVHWGFNAWGGLYSPWVRDAQVAQKLLDIERLDRYVGPMILEGGSIHVDGEGTLLTTRECLLNPNRNPGLSATQIEALFSEFLGVSKVIWLPKGLLLDEAGGHVDNVCAFVRPGEVALSWCEDTKDPDSGILSEALEILEGSTDASGRRLKIHRIPQAPPQYVTEIESHNVDLVDSTVPREAGLRMACSYLNYYLANGGVVVPTFEDPADERALNAIADVFPEREVVGVPAREVLFGGGNIHCCSLHQPSGS